MAQVDRILNYLQTKTSAAEPTTMAKIASYCRIPKANVAARMSDIRLDLGVDIKSEMRSHRGRRTKVYWVGKTNAKSKASA